MCERIGIKEAASECELTRERENSRNKQSAMPKEKFARSRNHDLDDPEIITALPLSRRRVCHAARHSMHSSSVVLLAIAFWRGRKPHLSQHCICNVCCVVIFAQNARTNTHTIAHSAEMAFFTYCSQTKERERNIVKRSACTYVVGLVNRRNVRGGGGDDFLAAGRHQALAEKYAYM